MKHIKTDVLIIGGGLTGLTLAYLLQKANIDFIVVEARECLGGRILTKYNVDEAPIELGATWIIDQQNSALELLKELNISVFEQHYGNIAIYHPNGAKSAQLVQLPKNDSKSYRVTEGTSAIITALAERINNEFIKTNEIIKKITLDSERISVESNDFRYNSKYVVSTLPPLLLSKHIEIKPDLPNDISTLMANTHTWMHDSIRVGLTYKTPFWKADKTSGTIYSSNGPIQEFYDHSNAEENRFALSGFVNSSYFEMSQEDRKTEILKQLQSYYGEIASDYLNYEECIWKDEEFTTAESDTFLMPQSNNGHPLFQNSYLNHQFFIAGAETSNVFPGKMEGAVRSAKRVLDKIISHLN